MEREFGLDYEMILWDHTCSTYVILYMGGWRGIVFFFSPWDTTLSF